MTTLGEARDAVRTQLDLDEDDLSDDTADLFLREGFNRTFAAERRWPFFQASWQLTLPAAATSIDVSAVDPGIAQFVSFLNAQSGIKLLQIDAGWGEDNFQGSSTPTTANPLLYSIWGGVIQFWPTIVASDDERTFNVRGYRKPTWSSDEDVEMDGDPRLHSAVVWYASSLAYAQLEDPELEAQYLARWQGLMEDIRLDVMRPQHSEPMILNGGLQARQVPYNSYHLDLSGV